MKIPKKTIIIACISLLWVGVMFVYIQREFFPKTLQTMESTYQDTLKDVTTDIHRRMIIYYGNYAGTKVGYFNTSILPQLDRTTDISTSCELAIPIRNMFLGQQLATLFGIGGKQQGDKFEVKLQTDARIGPDRQLKQLQIILRAPGFDLEGKGVVQGRNLVMDISLGGMKNIQTISFPIGSMVADPLSGPGKFGKLEVGKVIHMRWFDPITQQSRNVVAEVKGREEIAWGGRMIPTYVVRMSFPPFSTTAWVDDTGDIIKYQIFSFTLMKEM